MLAMIHWPGRFGVTLAVGLLLSWAAPPAPAHEADEGHDHHASTQPAGPTTQFADPRLAKAAADMAEAATHFWAALTPEQQAKAHYEMSDEERFDWHFIPKPRKGLPWKEMTEAQRALGHAFLSTGLSQRAYAQAETIMSLEDVLKGLEKDNPKAPVRDPENYFFTVFGKPGPDETWAWRVEGHHLSLNFTIAEGKGVVGGPLFFGANPAEVREGPRKGLRVLGREEDQGRAFVKALDNEQRKIAIIATEAPKEVITGNSRKSNPGPPVGLPVSRMTDPQKHLLTELVKLYAHRLRAELADDDLRKIDQAGWDKVHFAWAGGIEVGDPHYYRIHGPTFLVEYDDTQNNANHIHTVWRDSANDFGEDLLREHYEHHVHDATHGHDDPEQPRK